MTQNELAEQTAFKSLQKFETEYLQGHPLLTEQCFVYLVKEEENIALVQRNLYTNKPPYQTLALIPLKFITAIEAMSAVEVEKEFSVGRFILLGTWSFLFPKKTEIEAAYLIIKWKVEHWTYEAIFRNEGDNAEKVVKAAQTMLRQGA